MTSKIKKSDFYTDEELKQMKEQWLKDKAQIDANPAFEYYYDQDREYERYLNNTNLKALFHHAAYLYHGHIDGTVFLYPNEKPLVSKIYKEIIKNGYYIQSKAEEKRIRAHFGKAVSRQTWKKIKR